MTDAEAGVVRADAPSDRTADVIDGPKVMRLQQMLGVLLAEMHAVEPDSEEEAHATRCVPRLLAEVGSALPDELLEELGLLVGPISDELTPSSARIILAQIEGWLGALAAEALSAVRTGQVVPA
ncbi:MAG TPA: proteasome activator [Acidimicrobiales bacterium]|nr:proteasome activator [Acidimicrobiales bacterium]